MKAVQKFTEQDMAKAIAAGQALKPPSMTSATQAGQSRDETLQLVNAVFARMHLIYGHRWLSVYRTEDALARAKREWAPEIARLTQEQCNAALARLKRYPALNGKGEAWPPSLPEFIDLARPTRAEIGVPDNELAYLEARTHAHRPREHDWSHRAVFYAGEAVGWWLLSNGSTGETKSAFMSAYSTIVERLRNGESLMWIAPPDPEIEPEASTPSDVEIQDWRERLRDCVVPGGSQDVEGDDELQGDAAPACPS